MAEFWSSQELDLPQVDLINFRVEYISPLSGRASDEVARGRLVSLEGFSFAFRAKNEEWRDLQLVSQIAFGTPWIAERIGSRRSTKIIGCVCVSPASIERANLKKKWLRRKILHENWRKLGEGSLLTNILCRNCADKNETVVRKILASSKVELFPAPVSAETNTFLPDRYASTVFFW